MNKKKILAIILVIVVILLGGASIYVATQLSSRQAVAPNAPESKPAASETTTDTWVGSAACSVSGTATTNSLSWSKAAYSNDSSNTSGSYTMNSSNILSGDGALVKPEQTYVYWMTMKNSGDSTVNGTIVFKDVLTDNNLDKLTYVDGDSGCSYASSTRTVTCTRENVSVNKDVSFGSAFRVKLASDVADGSVIKNTYTATFNSSTGTASNSSTLSNPSTSITGQKTAYKHDSTNTAGSYSLSTEMNTVSKSQTYVYAITVKNTGSTNATGIVIKDSLANNSDITFMDTVSGCSWTASTKLLTCNTTLNPDESKVFSFRVKAADGIANGSVVSNTANVTSDNAGSLTLTKDLTISTVVGCNNTCTSGDECSTGLTCDSTTSKCRLATCLAETDCICGTTVTTTVNTVYVTATPTKVATKSATPTILPETGILDLPGVAAFGGGLILAVVGILLAL